MSDRVIDAIRRVDPCPAELPPPPIESVLARLREETESADPADTHERPRQRSCARSRLRAVPAAAGTLTVALSTAAAVALAVLAIVVLGHAHRTGSPAARTVAPLACRSEVRVVVLPVWARAGFSAARPRMPFAVGSAGRIAAIPFGSLNSPPTDHNNKILWVSHVRVRDVGANLKIQAQRMSGTTPVGRPVNRTVIGGPGPSIIDVPSPGCWRFTLRWSGWTDHVDLQYR
jgi:hypothetical protein